ncbi:hypothetical protein LuPra_05152 [Luteitalea pratensis]|uniref:Uncharacterized protein n=1 Tax=Luteitalea pratensis TaxID=1855912 RepID=A0A143PVM4_LUTPR|nr:hypothetical protein LuPra_05152 [Luteitalea pratensis]
MASRNATATSGPVISLACLVETSLWMMRTRQLPASVIITLVPV